MQQLYHYHEIPLHVAGGVSFPVVLDILGEKRVLSLEYPHLNLITFLYSRSFLCFTAYITIYASLVVILPSIHSFIHRAICIAALQ